MECPNSLNDYDYELPKERIAQYPLADRTAARLLVCDRRTGTIQDRHIRDLPELLGAGDALVLNDSRVIPARLVGYRESTGGAWEGLFLHADRNRTGEFVDSGPLWRILCQTRGQLRAGEWIRLERPESTSGAATGSAMAEPAPVRLELVERTDGGGWIVRPECAADIAVNEHGSVDTFTLLGRVGWVPLPPYIRHGEASAQDVTTYQTVYASEPGSVAAPTAGLHFTQPLLDELGQRGVATEAVTLHVGLGTFRPITTQRLEDHAMHTEWARITPDAVGRLRQCRADGGRVVAVGTTAMRVLETAARDGELAPFIGETDLFIRPLYTFHACDALLTNFHFPKTTLLVLVRTFGGDALIRHAYEHAIDAGYRFFSYGDAMLIV